MIIATRTTLIIYYYYYFIIFIIIISSSSIVIIIVIRIIIIITIIMIIIIIIILIHCYYDILIIRVATIMFYRAINHNFMISPSRWRRKPSPVIKIYGSYEMAVVTDETNASLGQDSFFSDLVDKIIPSP